jgi:hypothetical protein
MGFQKPNSNSKKKKSSSSSSKVKISSQTPLFGSIEDGDLEEFELCCSEQQNIKEGGKTTTTSIIDERNKNGWTAFMQAAFSDRAEFLRRLISLCPEQSSIKDYINLKCKDGDTALHYACCQDSIECIEILIEHGADVTIKDLDGETCSDVAKPKAKKLLLSLGQKQSTSKTTTTDDEAAAMVL